MNLIIFKIWLFLLAVIDLMLIIQILSRIALFVAGKTDNVDWTGYNKVMLSVMAVAFAPVAAAVLYLRRD